MDPNATPVFDKGYGWMNPVLGLQPDAFFMHGAAAGTGEPQFLEHIYPGYPKAQLQHSQAFRLSSAAKSGGQPRNTLGLNYVCLYPGCELRFTDEDLLDKHIKAHFSSASSGTSWATKSNGIGSSSSADMSYMHHKPTSAVPTKDLGAMPYVKQASDRHGKIPCKEAGCEKVFGRLADLERHAKSHQIGPREFECLAPECRRKGVDGFWRIDKLKDHLAAKHPGMKVERWYYGFGGQCGGLRDAARVAEHEDVMFRKGYEPKYPGDTFFYPRS
ncbi:MAG: hypothetical protein Q9167_000695 [Letrouitia subvulpina]